MLKNLCEFLKNNARLEIFMSVILLVSVTAIACNVDKVVEKQNKYESERKAKQNKDIENKGKAKFNGKTIVIDPGHGGKDPGKIGINGAKEKDVNLAISKELEQILNDNGFKVVMTRTQDKALSGEGKFSKIGDLNARCKIINDTYASAPETVLISIHQNSFTSESVHGAQSFYYKSSENSKRLAEIIQGKMNNNINTDKAKITKENNSYYMLINSKCPGIIIECGF